MKPANPEKAFERELEIFRTECESAAVFYYAYLTVHSVAADESVYNHLNTAPMFWNANLAALQLATFITLGRIFDSTSPHNIGALLKLARGHPEIFSKAALGARKKASGDSNPPWLEDYLDRAYIPKRSDFVRLEKHVQGKRELYEGNYKKIRNKVLAHKEIVDETRVAILFAKTKIDELQRLLVFLTRLYEALWQLFVNGRKPVLRARRHSMTRMRGEPSSSYTPPPHERLVPQIEKFLTNLPSKKAR